MGDSLEITQYDLFGQPFISVIPNTIRRPGQNQKALKKRGKKHLFIPALPYSSVHHRYVEWAW